MQRQVISTPNAPAAIGPYSQAIKASGTFVFFSGQVPLRPDGTMVEGDIRKQCEQVMNNLAAVLEASGLTFAHVVKTTILLSSMDHFGVVNEVYGARFASEPPARATFSVVGLPKGADVEIEMIAVCSD
jgi:2-iminobutanoate/2-iminopropanoate deaminase